MKPLATPQDKQKAIGLGVAVVVVFAMVIKNTLGASGTPPPVDGGAPTVAVSGGPAGSTPAPAGGSTVAIAIPGGAPAAPPADPMIDPPVLPPGEIPSPFHRDIYAYKGPLPTPKVEPKTPLDPIRPPTTTRKGPGDIFNPLDGKLPPPVIIPDEPMSVMGVITGDKPVAVIKVGSQQFIVDRGAKFGRGLRLKSVSETQVVIESGGALRILRVGARPPSPNPL